MSVCAGSSTKVFRTRWSGFRFAASTLALPGFSPVRKRRFFKVLAGKVQMDTPGRIGFMSTQRRENRWRRKICTRGAKASGMTLSGPAALLACTYVSGGTAPPEIPVRLATNSLHSGYRIVRLVLQDLRQSSPPLGAGPGAETGTPAIHGSSHSHTPAPSGPARFHPA